MRYIFLDCGSHLGESVKAFQETKLYQEHPWEIYSFEANPYLDQLIMVDKPFEINFIPKAVWIKDGTILFYLDQGPGSEGSTLYSEKKSGTIDRNQPTVVHCLDLSHWIMNNFSQEDHIILKMDVEGAEYEILKKMLADQSINYVNKLYVELHAEKIGYDLEEEAIILERIRELGIEIVTEGELNLKYPKNLRESVPGIWFLGEDRLNSAKNSQEIGLIYHKLDQIDKKIEELFRKANFLHEQQDLHKEKNEEKLQINKEKYDDRLRIQRERCDARHEFNTQRYDQKIKIEKKKLKRDLIKIRNKIIARLEILEGVEPTPPVEEPLDLVTLLNYGNNNDNNSDITI